MDRESLYGSRVRYEERLCAVKREDYAPQASDQTYCGWSRMAWLIQVKNLMVRRVAAVIGNDIPLPQLTMTIPAQKSAYSTWLCLCTRGERLC